MKVFKTPLANDIDATDGKMKYDAQVKKVLANKIVLAWILKYTMKEFVTMDILEIQKCISSCQYAYNSVIIKYNKGRKEAKTA